MSDRKAEDEDPDLHIYSDLHESKKTAESGSDLLRIFFAPTTGQWSLVIS
jgi:hypothetical protein